MSITILTNVASLKTQTQLAKHTKALTSSFERLSSGLRINRAVDDPVGLAIADNLRAEYRIMTTAVRNANDGVSLISIADGALEQIGNVLYRMAELAETSANGIYNTVTRSPIQAEFSALASEITRIARTTSFNGILLLSQTANASTSFSFQVGKDSSSNSQITVSAVRGTLEALGLGDGNENPFVAVNGTTDSAGRAAALTSLDCIKVAIQNIAQTRGSLGAAESRLSHAIANLQISSENVKTAESQIRDVDVAQEAANLTRLNILQQAGAAILGQANQQADLVLRLLK